MAYEKLYEIDVTRRYFIGLSGDSLPTDCSIGDLLIQTDLRKEFIYGSTSGWALKQKFST